MVSGEEGKYLPEECAIVGQVHAGLATVEQIGALGTASERPSEVVRIDSIRIKRRGC